MDKILTDDIDAMLTDCMNRESKLTEWEGNFLSNISKTLDDRGSLSDKQYTQLEKIWERVT